MNIDTSLDRVLFPVDGGDRHGNFEEMDKYTVELGFLHIGFGTVDFSQTNVAVNGDSVGTVSYDVACVGVSVEMVNKRSMSQPYLQ